jgi:hypothetical protein
MYAGIFTLVPVPSPLSHVSSIFNMYDDWSWTFGNPEAEAIIYSTINEGYVLHKFIICLWIPLCLICSLFSWDGSHFWPVGLHIRQEIGTYPLICMSCELYPVDFCCLQEPANRLPCISVTQFEKDSMSEQYNWASYIILLCDSIIWE